MEALGYGDEPLSRLASDQAGESLATLWGVRSHVGSEIFAHKLRSTRTLVGIVLGTTSLVVMVSVIGGAAESIRRASRIWGSMASCSAVPQRPEDRIERKAGAIRRACGRAMWPSSTRQGRSSAAPLYRHRDRVRMNGRDFNVSIEV